MCHVFTDSWTIHIWFTFVKVRPKDVCEDGSGGDGHIPPYPAESGRND